jgi:hypothetical protein
VFDEAIKTNAAKMREGSVPADCLLSLVVAQGSEGSSYVAPSSALEQPRAATSEIRMSIDEDGKRVIFERWGEMKGANAQLLIVLTEPFRDATRKELAPERYPFLQKSNLIRQIECRSDEVLRRRILRCRNKIKKIAKEAGGIELSIDAVIETSQWHGYRLNPDRVRLVALSELSR